MTTDKERIIYGKIGEVELDDDGYIKWIRVDRGIESFIVYPLINPNTKEWRMSVSQSK